MASKASSKRLLKFPNDKAQLAPDGLALIRGLKGNVCPVILIGDGRAGKSYIGSRLVNVEHAFHADDTAEPVTEGIDVVAVPVGPLIQSLPSDAREGVLPVNKAGETLLVLDCEGGNNAMAAVRTLVNVFGIVVGTCVVFVAHGMASEAALQNLGASLAARSLIKPEGEKFAEPHLLFVVNKNMLQYKEGAFEDLLNAQHKDKARQELRESVKDFFGTRSFMAVPLDGEVQEGRKGGDALEAKIADIRAEVLKMRKPLSIQGATLDGSALAGLLELVTKEIQNTKEVSFPSMHRYVILDSFLMPTAERIIQESQAKFPSLDDYDPSLGDKDPRAAIKKLYELETGHVAAAKLVAEARDFLDERLNSEWQRVVDLNEDFGNQIRETVEETREVEKSKENSTVGGVGPLSKCHVQKVTNRLETRTLTHRKRGGEPERTEWADTNNVRVHFVPTAFEQLGMLPILRGKITEQSRNIRKVLTFGKDMEQARSMLLRHCHLVWWEKDQQAQGKPAKGCLNFIVHSATIEPLAASPTCFAIKPAAATWLDHTSFSGEHKRVFVFDAVESEVSRDAWVDALRKHIEVASQIREQISVERAVAEIGVRKFTLAQFEGS